MGALTVSQIAIAMVLLAAGGLMIRSFQALLRVDPGLDPSGVLTFKLELPMATTYPSQEARDAFFAALLDRVEALPGVSAATFASAPPLEDEPLLFPFTRPGSGDSGVPQVSFRLVAAEYFALLRIPIVRGRAFGDGDRRSAPSVAIVSRALARAVWSGDNSIGERIHGPFGGEMEVVGVAGDVRTTGLDGEPGHIVYIPVEQGGYNFMTVIAKAESDPRTFVPAIRNLVKDLDANLPLHDVRTLDELVTRSVAQQRFQALLVGAFSAMVFALAIVGTYGVVSYGVSERTSEIGIRIALGATGKDIRRLVLREGARLALLGIVIGGSTAVALSGALTRFVFDISTLDIVTFTAAPVLLGAAALLAVLVPAHRATRVDPLRVLREE
jgi:putative ABC transport system permease protein